MLLVAGHGREMQERLATELADVESRFAAELLSDLTCVNDLVSHIERYRGKMLRPMLVLASGMAAGSPPSQGGARGGSSKRRARENDTAAFLDGSTIPPPLPEREGSLITDAHRVVATVVEMVHMATLVHDDILDDAQVRRRGSTVNTLSGNEAAVMLGDYLISHAYHLCSSLDDPSVSRFIADTTNTVCEGELLQLANRNNWSLDEGTYFEIIRRKTASLTGACCRMGAILHDSMDDVQGDALYTYGEQVGVAFQVVDDLLDLAGDEKTVGKSLGRDLAKGKLTLPVIHFLASADSSLRGEMLKLIQSISADEQGDNGNGNGRHGDAAETDSRVVKVRDAVIGSSSMDYARRRAAELIDGAKAALRPLPESPAKALLFEMAAVVLSRKA
ncbi:MAG: polyprenyl synthetase family protein [Phycisphaeraceae bacterium]